MTKGGAKWQELPSCDVARLCSYISDDGTIASYFRIPREVVQSVRAQLQKPPHREPATDRNTKNGDAISANDTDIRRKAENASICMREALERMFERWEKRNGFQPGAAKILLPAGYRL